MDKNTITGLVIIFLILMGFSYFNRPSEEDLEKQRVQDSITTAQQKIAELKQKTKAEKAASFADIAKPIANDSTSVFNNDSTTNQIITLKSKKFEIEFDTKGGSISSLWLKEFTTHDSLPLYLWKAKRSELGLLLSINRQNVNTKDFNFTPTVTKNDSSQILSMRLSTSEGYIEYLYTIPNDSYEIGYKVIIKNLGNVITGYPTLTWRMDMPQFEKSKDFENRYTDLSYKFLADDVDNLSASSDDEESISAKLKWVACKQQFFSSVLIADDFFTSAELKSVTSKEDNMLKNVSAEIPLMYDGKDTETYSMKFFFGPNSFNLLKEYGNDIELYKLVNLGWSWLAWFNRYVVIPLFTFLHDHVTINYGIIILLLTLIIKGALFPFTYKSYLSQAKMRVLKPQIEEINSKIPKEKSMERQQATMKLYKQAGVNPLGGCLPMVMQMPILIALFWFFPGAFELRQQSFLWATDLASYDSIATLPFTIPFYGNHVSLFCLLMTATNILYTWMNSKNQVQNEQMKGMSTMMYLMPLMFLFVFNQYSAGLSYYYFIATLFTIIQTWIIKKYFVNDEKLLHDIQVAQKKPVKKSGFQARLQRMQKEQERRARENSKNRKR